MNDAVQQLETRQSYANNMLVLFKYFPETSRRFGRVVTDSGAELDFVGFGNAEECS